VVPIKQNVFCGPVKLFINVGPKFELPETVKDEDVKLFDIVVIPLTFKDDKHVILLLNIVKPDTYNDVFIDVPAEFNRIASHDP
jgi:hypothetical protein